MSSFFEYCKCDECPLRDGRIGSGHMDIGLKKGHPTGPVFGEGTKPGDDSLYDVIFVGMAPALNELAESIPMVGRSGKLLRMTADKLGYTSYYITNCLLCMIPEELTDREQTQAIRCCHERLFEDIYSRKPRLIVTLGNMPLQALTGKDLGITEVQGRMLPGLIRPVLPVLHPAAVLRRTEEAYDFVDAMGSGRRWLAGRYQQAIVPRTVLVDDSNMGEVCRLIDRAGIVAVDLETTKTGFYPYGRDPDRIRCIALAVDSLTAYIVPGVSSPYFEPHPDYSEDPRLKMALSKAQCVFHNSTFDIGFLKKAGYQDTKIYYDTFLAHYMLDEREYSHGLKKLAQKYLGAYDWEKDIKRYLPNKRSSYDLIPDDKLYFYASHDVCYTYQLYERFVVDVSKGIYSDLLMPCANMFSGLRHRGIPIDVEFLMNLDEVFEKELDITEEELRQAAGRYVNPLSPPEVARLLYDDLKLPVNQKFGRSTSKKLLEQYRDIPEVDKVLECRELSKLKSTYVMGVANFLDTDFRIHPLTKLHGAVTGRISTEDPSVMNVTKKGGIKKLYHPDKGHRYLMQTRKEWN